MSRILLIVALTFCLGQGCPPPVSEPPISSCSVEHYDPVFKVGFNPLPGAVGPEILASSIPGSIGLQWRVLVIDVEIGLLLYPPDGLSLDDVRAAILTYDGTQGSSLLLDHFVTLDEHPAWHKMTVSDDLETYSEMAVIVTERGTVILAVYYPTTTASESVLTDEIFRMFHSLCFE